MNNPLPPKERMKIHRQSMPEQPPLERAHNFLEVNRGLDPAVAQQEAMRCLSCKSQHCFSACPVGVKVRDFIDLVVAGDYLGAAAKIREDNVLPAITGRVCPQEKQCEARAFSGTGGIGGHRVPRTFRGRLRTQGRQGGLAPTRARPPARRWRSSAAARQD
jgi:glutamate synthase (NADPH/NADH) small chain